ncbi:hypothetical protein [Providencia phage PSTRCR_120]|uniref:Uncharacterized protein n=1 Tax=Providencia phage PSTRCR_120 TaxID=2800826 RepID=A0A7T6ZM79_9CAUD|nr:hypothetical protein [Providencia phage PSTRCR_120]
MSKQLDNLIAILRDSSKGVLCQSAVCDDISCEDCPFDSASALKEVVKELEVLHYAKA